MLAQIQQKLQKQESLLGLNLQCTRYMSFVTIDFFFEKLGLNGRNLEELIVLNNATRVPRQLDLWIFLFRHGFFFQHKQFIYNWEYLDWLRQLGNEYLMAFFGESVFRVRWSLLRGIVMQTFQCLSVAGCNNIVEYLPRAGTCIGSSFIALENMRVGIAQWHTKIAANILECYAIDNYGWIKDTDIMSKKHPCVSMLHALFLWSTALIRCNYNHSPSNQPVVENITNILNLRKTKRSKNLLQENNNQNKKHTAICNGTQVVPTMTCPSQVEFCDTLSLVVAEKLSPMLDISEWEFGANFFSLPCPTSSPVTSHQCPSI